MGLSYLNNKNWSEITRDERTYCAELFFKIRGKENDFIKWLNENTKLEFSNSELKQYWEIGYEVCFYRDVYKHLYSNDEKKVTFSSSGYSPKRTFDLCLFSNNRIIIIEAKAQQKFDSKQNKEFMEDKSVIPKILNRKIKVQVVALASSVYFNGKRKPLDQRVFDGQFSWDDLYKNFSSNKIYKQANESFNN